MIIYHVLNIHVLCTEQEHVSVLVWCAKVWCAKNVLEYFALYIILQLFQYR